MRSRFTPLLGWLLLFVSGTGVALQHFAPPLNNPYTRPERTAVLQAWDEAEERNDQILFVGDSRTGMGFIPAVVDAESQSLPEVSPCFNLAGPGSTIPSDAGVLDAIISHKARPRLIVWGVDKRQATPMDLGGFQRNEATPGILISLLQESPTWTDICTLGFGLTSGARVLLQSPVKLLPQYRRELQSARRVRSMGWAIGTDKWSTNHNRNLVPEAPKTAEQWGIHLANIKKDANAITPFEDEVTVSKTLQFGIRRSKASGAATMIVNMPMQRKRAEIESAYGYAAYIKWIRRVCQEENVAFIDLNAPPLLPPDGDFIDSHHLSPQGAERLSRRFTREFIVPALKASPKEAQP